MKQIILALTAWLLGGTSWAQSPIDVHAHIIPPEYREFLQRHGAELEETFPLPVWEAEKHLAFMDSANIQCTVLTAKSTK